MQHCASDDRKCSTQFTLCLMCLTLLQLTSAQYEYPTWSLRRRYGLLPIQDRINFIEIPSSSRIPEDKADDDDDELLDDDKPDVPRKPLIGLLSAVDEYDGQFDYRWEYNDWGHIHSKYLNADSSKCPTVGDGSAALHFSEKDFAVAFAWADNQIKIYEQTIQEYLAEDHRGLQFSRFVHQATVRAKFNELVTSYLVSSRCVSKAQLAISLPQVVIPDRNTDFCDLNEPRSVNELECDPKYKYRRLDGRCNNLINTNWGSAFHCHRRLLPSDYSDGVYRPRMAFDGQPLPSTRLLSNELLPDVRNIDKRLSLMNMQWGQFLVHDVVRTINFLGLAIRCCGEIHTTHPECWPIVGFPPDTATLQNKQKCINFIRSATCNTCRLGPRDQLNVATPVLDLSQVYGGNQQANASSLRSFVNGYLRSDFDVSGEEVLPSRRLPLEQDPLDLTPCNPPPRLEHVDCFYTGDGIRGNQHPAVGSMHVIMHRRHNQHADALQRVNPHWDDETLFQEARRLLIAESNMINFAEYLPSILGKRLVKYFDLNPLPTGFTRYRHDVDPSSVQAYAVAGHRFGHSQIASMFRIVAEESRGYLLRDKFFDISEVWMGHMDGILNGLMTDPSLGTDPYLVADVKDFLFRRRNGTGAIFDLPAINTQRGRDHGVPGYVYFLEYCTGMVIVDWEDLKKVIPKVVVGKLKQLYKHINDIDLFIGGLSEAHLPGANLGPTFACLVGLQFHHLKFGDRFYFEHANEAGSFSVEQLDNIRQTASLANLLCKTTSLVVVSSKPMFRPSVGNPTVACYTLPDIDYSLWRELREYP